MKRIAVLSVAAALAVVGFAPAAQAGVLSQSSSGSCHTIILIPLC